MPSFVNMASLTKLASLTGNEEFQVSATQKVTATQIANKVQLNQVFMGGFEAIPINGVEKIKDTNSLIGAMKILYSLSGNGRVKVVGDANTLFGFCSIRSSNNTLCDGILFDCNLAIIYVRSGFAPSTTPSNLTDSQWIAEIKKGKQIPMESGSGVTAPVQIAEYGAFYDYTELNNVPAGSVTAWFAPGSNVDGDLGPFKGMSEHTEGIYIAIRGSESDSYREGIMVAYRADDVEKGIAYAHVQGDPGSGGIVRQTDWMTITPVGGGGAVDPIYIGSDESITMIVENHSWDKNGEIVPVFIEPSSDIYDHLPQIKNASFPQDESTIVGYAQRVYDGGDYYHIGLTFTIWETSGRIAYRGEVLMNNSSDIIEAMLTPIGTFASPIPGFTKIANQYDLALSTGSLMTVNFNYEVINSTAMFIDAELRSSAGPNADIRSVAIPVTFFNPVQAATLMDLNTRSIAPGTNIGQIRLNVASVVTGAKGIQGLQVVVVSNNLGNPSDVLRIKGVYANI